MTFVLASNNSGKLLELNEILSCYGVQVVSQRDVGIFIDVEENGTTFTENALKKAKSSALASGKPTIADDSGLVVRALNGAPGVYSARYGTVDGTKLSDSERNAFLLHNMEDKNDRTAKFVCAIACVFPSGDVITSFGECHGEILRVPRGKNGFGYDPIFFVPEYGKSMAELTSEEKNRISHRAMALADFASKFKKYI